MGKLGEIIRRHRKEKGLKGFQFAKKLGIHPTYITLIERYNKIPAPPLIRKIERELGIVLKDIYIKEKIPLDFLPKPDLTISDPSGTRPVYLKKPEGNESPREQIFNYILYFALHYKNMDATKAAFSVVNKINPSKSNDKELINEVASSIKTFRNVYTKLS